MYFVSSRAYTCMCIQRTVYSACFCVECPLPQLPHTRELVGESLNYGCYSLDCFCRGERVGASPLSALSPHVNVLIDLFFEIIEKSVSSAFGWVRSSIRSSFSGGRPY